MRAVRHRFGVHLEFLGHILERVLEIRFRHLEIDHWRLDLAKLLFELLDLLAERFHLLPQILLQNFGRQLELLAIDAGRQTADLLERAQLLAPRFNQALLDADDGLIRSLQPMSGSQLRMLGERLAVMRELLAMLRHREMHVVPYRLDEPQRLRIANHILATVLTQPHHGFTRALEPAGFLNIRR